METSQVKSFTGQVQMLLKTKKDFPQKLQQRLVLESNNVKNPFQFIVGLFNEGVLCDGSSDSEASFGLKEMIVQLAMMIACSKGADAIGGLLKALEESGNSQLVSALRTWVQALEINTNENLLGETYEWLEASQATKTNSLTDAKSLANHPSHEESTAVKSTYFEQAAPSHELSNLETLIYQQRSATKGTSLVQFDKEKLIACSADGTLNLWNWRLHEEEPIKMAVKVKNITCFEYDEEILMLGSAQGTVHLFNARTVEEKWSVRFGEPVISLKFAQSSLVVITRSGDNDRLWWAEITRPDMRLLNQRYMYKWEPNENTIPGSYICPDFSFIYSNKWVYIHDTKSGTPVEDDDKRECCLAPPAVISTLTVCDLMCKKRVVVAGCIDGMIAMWNTWEFVENQTPVKTFEGHSEKVVSLCSLNGHLLSLDESGKFLMWSGYDLENKNIPSPVPRLMVADNFSNATSLVTHERWFATSSSENGIINLWAVPDLWLRTG